MVFEGREESCQSDLETSFSEHVPECGSSWEHFRGSLEVTVMMGARWPLSASYFLINTLCFDLSHTQN